MRIAKAIAVSILFLLIPHQAPFAGPSGGEGQPAASEKAGSTESPVVRVDQTRLERVLSNEGFVWSVASSRSSAAAWSSASDHLETDGYSWSVRSAGSRPTIDPAP